MSDYPDPPYDQPSGPYWTRSPYISGPVPIGCICPPGANKDCERPDCPRKNHMKATP